MYSCFIYYSLRADVCFSFLGNFVKHMEGSNNSPHSASVVLLAYDATKDHNENELTMAIDEIRLRGDILKCGDKLIVLGVLQSVRHPMGHQMEASTNSFLGTNAKAIEEEVSNKIDMYSYMLLQSAEHSKDERVSIDVKITAGMPIKKIVLQEAITCQAAWVILDRQLRKDLKFYLRQIPCKVALIQDGLSVEVLRNIAITKEDVPDQKFSYSVCKAVELPTNMQDSGNDHESLISSGSYVGSASSQEGSDNSFVYSSTDRSSSSSSIVSGHSSIQGRSDRSSSSSSIVSGHSSIQRRSEYQSIMGNRYRAGSHISTNYPKSSEVPVLCSGCGIRTALYFKESMKFKFSEIQAATSDFSKEQLLGEGGYGHVYKGRLKDGQIIAAKVRKEASAQGDSEFRSEVYVLSFARHKNIVMLLGYCGIDQSKILVYEYICNKSLHWHLFCNSASVLEWHKRHAIAIGTAKGLRFLHEECRGCPIIHRDLRPSNILLTHDFIPMIGDFGLAKWKTGEDVIDTRVIGTLGYLAPEYVENGIVSVRTDVFAYGVVLLQLISGRKVIHEKTEGQPECLLQWAEPLIASLALHELIDPRLGELDDTYELYNMARTAAMCVRRSPEMRPSMGEVVRLLEVKSGYNQDWADQFIPHYQQ